MHGYFPSQCQSPSPTTPNVLSGGFLTLEISLTVPPLLLAPDLKHWSTDYSDCGGTKQSPINVDTAQAIFSPDLRPIQLSGYSLPATKQLKLKNNGHTGEGTLQGLEHRERMLRLSQQDWASLMPFPQALERRLSCSCSPVTFWAIREATGCRNFTGLFAFLDKVRSPNVSRVFRSWLQKFVNSTFPLKMCP